MLGQLAAVTAIPLLAMALESPNHLSASSLNWLAQRDLRTYGAREVPCYQSSIQV